MYDTPPGVAGKIDINTGKILDGPLAGSNAGTPVTRYAPTAPPVTDAPQSSPPSVSRYTDAAARAFAPGGAQDVTPVDEGGIRMAARAGVQGLIDEINKTSAEELTAASGRARALNASTGELGNPSGNAKISAAEKSVNDARDAKIAQILSNVDIRADSLVSSAKASARQNSADYQSYLKNQSDAAHTDLMTLAGAGVELSPDQKQKLMQQTGYDAKTFDSLYSSALLAGKSKNFINMDKPIMSADGKTATFLEQVKDPKTGAVSFATHNVALPGGVDPKNIDIVSRADGLYAINKVPNADGSFTTRRLAGPENDTTPTPGDDTTGTFGQGKSGDILSTAGLSIAAFNYLTQGTASMSRLSAGQRNQILNESQAWAKKKGIDISTFQSQYKAYNDVLQKNINRANQTQIMAGEVSGSADSLATAIDEMDWNKLGNVKAENIVKLIAGEQVNDPTTMKYATQIKFMANDLAGYMAAARGASSPELQDQRDAADIISRGLSKKSVDAFKESVNTNEEKVAGVVQKAVDSTRKQVWGLFGVGDKYSSSAEKDRAIVETALNTAGVKYQDAINGAQAGEIPVIDRATGQIGYVTANKFDLTKYVKL